MASDYLLELDGIKGESGDGTIKDALEIQSFSWGASNPTSIASGGGGGGGKVSFQDLHFTSTVSKASPLLLLFCANGTHIKKATLTVRKQGGEQLVYYKISLEDLVVSSYQTGGSNGSGEMHDQCSLSFTKIKFEYKPQKSDQSLDSAIEGGWDIKKNVKA